MRECASKERVGEVQAIPQGGVGEEEGQLRTDSPFADTVQLPPPLASPAPT